MINTDSKKTLTIKNSFISREFSIDRKRLFTVALCNLRTGRTLVPAENSEEFSITFATFPKRVVDCGELKVSDIHAYEADGISTAEFLFKPVKVKGCEMEITLSVSLGDNDTYIRRRLTIRSQQPGDSLRLDNISFDSLVFDPLIKKRQIPSQENCDMTGFQMELGQPVYVDSMFFGCEFPGAHNTVEDNRVCLKYYSGRALGELSVDGSYTSWQAVCGSAGGTDDTVLTHDFLEYIKDISTPLRFRRQYNSWYDHMQDIDDSNLSHSFYEIEKGCTRFGVAPLDAYVADDGWNDYGADFWSFNTKFPDELYPAKRLAAKFCSSFGLWLGPRGSYTKETPSFAKRIEAAGKGHYCMRSHDICVASSTYRENLEKLLLDYTVRFDLSYWKLDGFAKRPCKSTAHGHMTGGKDNLYFYTDLLEGFISIFRALRECRESMGKQLWLNVTCYMNPSPWLLQWVESVWIQNSKDVGFTETGDNGERLGGSDKDRMLTYRDDRYYDFYKVRQLQFPPSRLYNHDPIYGKTAGVSMSAEDFKQLLIMNACRGTAFWELYYSYSMMDDEKWAYSAAVLSWAEKNSRILGNSRMIGNPPKSAGVYGYSCWDGNDGIIALRNPSAGNASFTLYFDEKIGFTERNKAIPCRDVLTGSVYGDVSYGGSMEVQLQPHELRVLSFSTGVVPFTVPCAPEKARLLEPGVPITGAGSFTVRSFVSPESEGIIYSQGDELMLFVNSEGKFVFNVGGLTAVSSSGRDTAAQIAAVREPNSMLKLYVDGNLEASAYLPGVPAESLAGLEPKYGGKTAVFDGALCFDEVLS